MSVIERQPSVPARPRVHWFIQLCAYAIPISAFPSSLWRLIEVVPDMGCMKNAWAPAYITMVSIVSMAASVLCVGLVCRWGEVVPGWVPVIGGRIVSTRAATIAASAGTAVLAVVLGVGLVSFLRDSDADVELPGCPRPEDGPNDALFEEAYAPLLLWPPLLAIVTVAYYRRRTGRITGDGRKAPDDQRP